MLNTTYHKLSSRYFPQDVFEANILIRSILVANRIKQLTSTEIATEKLQPIMLVIN